jgi:hypothetical protein
MEVIVVRARGYELFYDTEDIDDISTVNDMQVVPSEDRYVQREPTGISHLNITFKPGKRALWRKSTEERNGRHQPRPAEAQDPTS